MISPPASLQDLDVVEQLEAASYPADEGADRAKLEFRITHASEFFMVSRRGVEIVGFVNGTLSADSKLTHDSMSAHDPQGSTLCIHSVVVREDVRRQGLGRNMLRHYVEEMKGKEQVKSIALICKENLVDFYKQCEFAMVGPSDVEHGADPWFEMRICK